MPIFLFQFEVRPRPNNPESKKIGGAVVLCWVDRPTQDVAETIARGLIDKEGWVIMKLEEASLITRETQNPEGMEYFEQAETDGEAVAFYTWSLDATDDQEDL